ncbi:right-handed parallel beta-helix repeat-containing protein [Roseimicrobium sp. ORNL1]|uniref:right-handed parallel beta-helix repeat-containing protein n=1 Tax=Roseimicrobium sp. ORNL1 TaxID=2711231 RepID=UPI0013E1251B|nr:right-handed parallel beta-helix repeat-containing protein [Roseimicrobium sp. ORNL1]QIF01756.1 hypothetical protein G5S37_09540 [Roseimicrobium sp. ORNL1]
MKFAASGRLLGFVGLSLLVQLPLAAPALAGSAPPAKNAVIEQEAQTHPMYLGTVTGGVKTSDEYTEGNFSIVAPVWSTLGADATLSGDVIYLEPYTSWGERGEVAASLGLGWRHLFGSQSVAALNQHDAPQAGFFDEGIFIGANVFIDMLDTEADNQFWQLGVGLEVGTRYVELRGNYYIPLSDRQLAEETRTVETIQRSSTSASQSITPTGALYATGNSIAQNAVFTTTATTTVSTTTIERLFRRYEEGMEGWDAELAVLIPGLDRYFDLRIIGGYYSFDNQPFGPQEGGTGNVEGWKTGVEIRPVPAVILTGTWYEDERLTGSDWTVGVQLQMPFELGDLGDGKGFWDRIGDAFTPRRRHLVERLAEPVRRQNAAIKVANSVDTETHADTEVKRVTKVTHRNGRLVIADDIIFVNNGGAVGNGISQAGPAETGAAEQPFNTIQEGADQAALNNAATRRLWTVYTQGAGAHGGGAYNESVTIGASTRFISSLVPVVGPHGETFGSGDRPLVQGGFAGVNTPVPIVAPLSFVSVAGYEIAGGYQPQNSASKLVPGVALGDDNAGIMLRNVSRVEIVDNVIHDMPWHGIVARRDDAGNLSILARGNHVSDAWAGIVVSGNADLEVQITGNTANNNLGGGIDASTTAGVISGVVSGNTSLNTANGAGFYLSAQTLRVDVLANQSNGNRNGISMEGGFIDGDFSGNTVNDNWESNIYIAGGGFTGDITNNTASYTAVNGIYLALSDGFTGNIAGNTTTNNFDIGFFIYAPTFSGSFTGNVSNDNGGDGFRTEIGSILIGPFNGNSASGNGGANFQNLGAPLANP